MADRPAYSVTRVRRNLYLDRAGEVVKGYEATIEFYDWGEIIGFDVPDLDPQTIAAIAEDYLRKREALAGLGG